MFNPYKIAKRKQYYRFITSGFIHKDWMHLIFNMFTLYFLGEFVEEYFKYNFMDSYFIVYPLFYLSAIVVSSIPTFFKHREHPYYNALGASGGVSSLVFSFILIAPTVPLCLFGILCLPGFILGALYLIYSIHMGKKTLDHVNHDAHLYGALYGIIFTIAVKPSIVENFINQLINFDLSKNLF